jgi:hypothetical protein
MEDVTADFVYVRCTDGDAAELYVSGYTDSRPLELGSPACERVPAAASPANPRLVAPPAPLPARRP